MFRTLTMMLAAFLIGCTEEKAPNIDARKIELTVEERQFVQDHRVVTWAVEENRPPFIYVEGIEVKGISPSYLALISKKTGLIFKPVPVGSFLEAVETVKRGDIDIVTSIRPAAEHTNLLGFSAPYTYNAGVFLFRLNSQPSSPLRAGLCQGDAALNYLKLRFPDIKIIQTADSEEAISLLEKGLLDVAIMNESTADFFATKSIIKMRKAPTDFDYPYSFGFKRENVLLGSILSKAIMSISVEDKKTINESWKIKE